MDNLIKMYWSVTFFDITNFVFINLYFILLELMIYFSSQTPNISGWAPVSKNVGFKDFFIKTYLFQKFYVKVLSI